MSKCGLKIAVVPTKHTGLSVNIFNLRRYNKTVTPNGILFLCLCCIIPFLVITPTVTAQEFVELSNAPENSNVQAGFVLKSKKPTTVLDKKTTREVFYYWFNLGDSLKKIQQFDLARNSFEEVLDVSIRVSDSAQINTLLQLGEVNTHLVEFSEAYRQLSACALLAQRAHRYHEAQIAYKLIGDLFAKAENFAFAYTYYNKSWGLSSENSRPVFVIQLLCALAETGSKIKKTEEANGFIHSAEALIATLIAKKDSTLEIKRLQIDVLKSKSAVQVQSFDIPLALNTLVAASDLSEKINDEQSKTDISLKMCDLWRKSNQSDLALSKIKEIQNSSENFISSALIKIYTGDIYFEQKNWSEAKKQYLLAENNSKKGVDSIQLQYLAHQLFLTHLNLGDLDGTKKYFALDTSLRVATNKLKEKYQSEVVKLSFNTENQENSLNALKLRDNRFLLIFGSIGSMLLIVLLSLILQNRTKNFNQLMVRNAEIQSQNKKLEESNEILTQFAYVAAHDLKEPLRSIGSYIGILQIKYLKDLPPAAGEYMQFINGGVKRMYLLLNDLLELSQVIRQQPGAEVVRPEEVLNDVRANLNSAIELKHAQIDYASNMPGVRMNRNHLMQLFQNLIGNALKFTTESPRVHVYATEEPTRIVFTVADNGIGIKKDYSSKIFVLFQQLNKKGSYEGTGIGLTICKNIVEKYNGSIWFESEENVGTKFHFSIPV